MFLHDITDILLEFTKCHVYVKKRNNKFYAYNEHISNIGFVGFTITWFVFRLYWYPLKVLYSSGVVAAHRAYLRGAGLYAFFNSLLWFLLFLDLYWFYVSVYIYCIYYFRFWNQKANLFCFFSSSFYCSCTKWRLASWKKSTTPATSKTKKPNKKNQWKRKTEQKNILKSNQFNSTFIIMLFILCVYINRVSCLKDL